MGQRAKKKILADIERWGALLRLILEFEAVFSGQPQAGAVSADVGRVQDAEADPEILSQELNGLKLACYDYLVCFARTYPHQIAFANGLKDFYLERTGRSLFSDYPTHIRFLKYSLRRGRILHETECYMLKESIGRLEEDPQTVALSRNLRVLISEFESSIADGETEAKGDLA